MDKIETGYRVGRRTWISDAWNEGTLAKADIERALAEYKAEAKAETEEVARARLAQSEAEVARDLFAEPDNTQSYEELLRECVERALELYYRKDCDRRDDVVYALECLLADWTDDVEDTDQFERVSDAHNALAEE